MITGLTLDRVRNLTSPWQRRAASRLVWLPSIVTCDGKPWRLYALCANDHETTPTGSLALRARMRYYDGHAAYYRS